MSRVTSLAVSHGPLLRKARAVFCSTPVVGPFATDASLHLIADALVAAAADGDVAPSIIHLVERDDGLDVGLRPLDGDHPSSLLLGFVAPAEWYAIGVLAAGWASPMPGRRGHGRTRVHVAALVSRSGEVAHRLHLEDRTHPLAVDAGWHSPSGEQIDLLRRSLDLPTEPPPATAGDYWAAEWLTRIVADPPDTWEDAAARHPAMRLLRDGEPHVHLWESMSVDEFVEVVSSFNRVCHWGRLRDLTIDELFHAPALAAEDAAWLDVGSFSRWLLSRCPPLSALRSRLDDLSPAVCDDVDDALDLLEVAPALWPEVDSDER